MSRARGWGLTLVFGLVLAVTPWANSQSPIRIKVGQTPKPEPIAETKLLMDGLTQPNFRGIGKLLKEQPRDAEAWTFTRGQALILAESANLLMLRPPKTSSSAQVMWLTRASELRDAASQLARAAGASDYLKARTGLVDVANTCNRCHQSFRVATRVAPFAEGP